MYELWPNVAIAKIAQVLVPFGMPRLVSLGKLATKTK
jgi:hypothetical protein